MQLWFVFTCFINPCNAKFFSQNTDSVERLRRHNGDLELHSNKIIVLIITIQYAIFSFSTSFQIKKLK